MVRQPPFQVVPYGKDLMVRCAECGDLRQVSVLSPDTRDGAEREARAVGRDHQRWTHPTEEEQMLDHLRLYEFQHMDGYCARCGHEGHEGKDCPTVTPDLLRGR